MPDAEDRVTIKKYLLGEITGEEQLREIEESLFADEEYYEELLRVETELAEEYARGGLTAGERQRVEERYLSSPERRRGINFALVVEEYFARREAGKTSGDPPSDEVEVGERNPRPNNVIKFPGVKRLLSSTSFKIAASVILVFALGAGAWRTFIYRSDLDRGLAALKEAYKNQRPTQARISMLDYALAPNERGDADRVNGDAKRRAGLFLQYAAEDAPSAASYHALGNHLLAAGQFDEALAQFTKASELDPNNARLQNDIGVALLEKAGAAVPDEEAGKGYADAGASLAHFERALELDGSLLDALFNRALALERLKAFWQAQEAWTRYLERDSSSGWAKEARRHLEHLEERRRRETSRNKEEVLREFLEAHRLGDDSRAWQVISHNREAITGKLISAQLVDAYLNFSVGGRPAEAREALRALHYAGELDSKYAGDIYTAEIARFYGLSPPGRLALLSRARQHMRRGFEWCQKAKFGDAAGEFEKARATFESVSAEPEIYFSDYWIGYSYQQAARSVEGLSILRSLIQVCKQRGYKWLLAQALNSSSNIQTALKNYSEAITETDQSLALSEQIGDPYTVQKNLAQQADKYRILGDHKRMLKYLGRCLEQSKVSWPGARQMWRNYDTAANAFLALGLYPAAFAYNKESLRLGLAEEDPSMIYVSLAHLGVVTSQLKNQEEGIELAGQALAIGQKLSGTPEGQRMTAYCALQLGHLYRQIGNTVRALESYEQAIGIYDGLKFQIFSYDAHKGKLLCHIALGDDEAALRELRTTLELVEANRKTILEEQTRHQYYDAEQSIYDLAVDFAHARLGDRQRAFDYSEAYRARSLLDLMRRPHTPAGGNPGPAEAHPVSEPLTLAQIRDRMPERTQILQYAVLEHKILIWFVSRGAFEIRESNVASGEVDKLVRRYRQLISNPPGDDEGEMRELAARLYDILLKPVESLLDADKVVCVVPDKFLNQLPFGALVSSNSGNYLIADYAVLFSPSSSVFTVSSEASLEKADSADEKLLSVGNSSFDRRAYPRLPELPSAEREAVGITEFYDGAKPPFVGSAASKERVTREMPDVDVVHFALHYVVDEDHPMNSRLLLANGGGTGRAAGSEGSDLQVFDLYRMNLKRLRLAVLSACQTGVERFHKGEGMVGMSRAFIASGVPTVVASLWPVESDATAELMLSFHRHRKRQGFPTVEALRRAQLSMLAGDGQRHPYYWAPFVVIGGYSTY
jgi:CHAT domain-containing protein/Tfp pilus assembly protein PilF